MQLDPDACYRALRTRDPRFDGRFFTGVRSTGIYCRPICPARTPKRANCVFLPCAAAAQEAGFRPCLRCRPESSPGTPAWAGTSTTVARGLRLIDGGALDTGGVAELALRLGIGERHLRRLFMQHVGASPQAIALTRRVLFAKQLIDETDLAMSDIAFSAGFSSIRRFNDAMLGSYQRSPRSLRRSRRAPGGRAPENSSRATSGSRLSLRLPYRPPLDWSAQLRVLGREAAPGVARVDGDSYLRTFALGDAGHETWGRVRMRPAAQGNHLVAELELSQARGMIRVADRLRRIFDLHADPREIQRALAHDRHLRQALRKHPGVRIPGAWDPFEFAVTTIVLGPRPGATGRRRLGDLVDRWGRELELHLEESPETAGEWPARLFPTAEALAGATLESLGLAAERTRALGGLAAAVASKQLNFDPDAGAEADANATAKVGADSATMLERLCAVPGLDEGTAQRILLRGLGEPDAFPDTDASLRRALATGAQRPLSSRALVRRAESWRPWRGYAAMLLWESDQS